MATLHADPAALSLPNVSRFESPSHDERLMITLMSSREHKSKVIQSAARKKTLNPVLMSSDARPLVAYHRQGQFTICIVRAYYHQVPVFLIGAAKRNVEAGDCESVLGKRLAFYRAITESPNFTLPLL